MSSSTPGSTVTAAFDSPVGTLRAVAEGEHLVGLWFADRAAGAGDAPTGLHPALDAARRWLDDYFAGAMASPYPPIALPGTAFQREVWQCLRTIEYAATWTYGQVAAAIGRPTAARAVAQAIGRNPVSIIVPCHRVIGSDGSLTGFGGGLERKRQLLDLERRVATGS